MRYQNNKSLHEYELVSRYKICTHYQNWMGRNDTPPFPINDLFYYITTYFINFAGGSGGVTLMVYRRVKSPASLFSEWEPSP